MRAESISFKFIDERGFTFIELLMVMVVLSILFQISLTLMIDLRKRAYDAAALADGKQMMNVATAVLLNFEDVDLNHRPPDGPQVGVKKTSGGPRDPVFTLSPGVRADITHTGGLVPGSSYVSAYFYHIDGTNDADPISHSGKREFYFTLDELSSTISSPSL